jgi:hypothetical protein
MSNPGDSVLFLGKGLEHPVDMASTATLEQAALDTEVMSRLQTTIDDVVRRQRRRNDLSFVYGKLSDDLLILIFEAGLPHWDDVETPQWLAFSQVCHRWRAVALAHPSLWARYDLRHHELSKEVRRFCFEAVGL